jgi:hypothetical protein
MAAHYSAAAAVGASPIRDQSGIPVIDGDVVVWDLEPIGNHLSERRV